ncbi:MAG TPA: hypothetical protein PKY81_08125 [bacterium]|nr:hypothetical protein [bacterium]HPN30910.1 hypothetical protein [bacterium]
MKNNFIIRKLEKIFVYADNKFFYRFSQQRNFEDKLFIWFKNGIKNLNSFEYENLKRKTLSYVDSMSGEKKFLYKYSASGNTPTLYSSVYACMIKSLFGEIQNLSETERREWADYFNSHQNQDDGLFYDEAVNSEKYNSEDYWGARHLAVHLLSCYAALKFKPKYKFSFIEDWYSFDFINKKLDSLDWGKRVHYTSNTVMNYCCILQYSRDFFNDTNAGKSIEYIHNWLLKKINIATGFWGDFIPQTPEEISVLIQAAYHFLVVLLYDGIKISSYKKIIDSILLSQNKFFGFGVKLNSSACEDIDSIDPLIRFSKMSDYKKTETAELIRNALIWQFANMNNDGGFVFRREEPLIYGHLNMSSKINESAMFPTWFRILTIAYISKFLNLKNNFIIGRSPGYEYV